MKIFRQEVTFSWIKENLAAIILIPTLIGGLWQLLELLFIGPAYIRFFSISQLVPDGILLISVVAIIIIPSQQWVKGLRKSVLDSVATSETEDQEHVSNNKDGTPLPSAKDRFFIPQPTSWISKRDGYIWLTLLLAITITISVLTLPDLLGTKGEQLSKLFKIVCLFAYFFFYLAVMGQIISLFLDIYKVKLNPKSNPFGKIFELFAAVFVLTALVVIINVMRTIHSAFALPNDLKNTQYLDCRVKANNKTLTKYELLYFNDKYIFVRVFEKPSNSYIEVFKFDEFTNSSNCINSTSAK
ncbi:MAG TPA: hypothetical protein VG890_13765 [Puia sp.]|nr:hypothetical protein [Puia sp.]